MKPARQAVACSASTTRLLRNRRRAACSQPRVHARAAGGCSMRGRVGGDGSADEPDEAQQDDRDRERDAEPRRRTPIGAARHARGSRERGPASNDGERAQAAGAPASVVTRRPGRACASSAGSPRPTGRSAPATSTSVACSMPSSPGEAFTSITSGPRSERSMSTPATGRPSDFAGRTASRRSRLGERHLLGAATLVDVGAELAGRTDATHRGDDAAADDDDAQVGALRLADELLDDDVGLEPLERLEHALGSLLGLGEHDADALRALEQLDDDRRPAEALEQVVEVAGAAREERVRDGDAVAGEQLERAQLVARARERERRRGREDALRLELAHDRRAVLGHGGADARNDRVDAERAARRRRTRSGRRYAPRRSTSCGRRLARSGHARQRPRQGVGSSTAAGAARARGG